MMKEIQSININSASIVDANNIADIHVRSWQTAYKDLLPNYVLDKLSIEDRAKRWEETLSKTKHGILKLILNDKMIGFSHATQSNDDDAKENTADIHAIYLEPSFFGKGYGKILMKATLTSLINQGFAEVTLWVMDNNSAAIGFYKKLGFSDDDILKPYTLNGGYEVMVKRYRHTLAK